MFNIFSKMYQFPVKNGLRHSSLYNNNCKLDQYFLNCFSNSLYYCHKWYWSISTPYLNNCGLFLVHSNSIHLFCSKRRFLHISFICFFLACFLSFFWAACNTSIVVGLFLHSWLYPAAKKLSPEVDSSPLSQGILLFEI